MKIFITGSAGFIGFSLSLSLLKKGLFVIGIDNLNNYYDVSLKINRLNILRNYKNYVHINDDICNIDSIKKLFNKYKPEIVINLAAQVGVRNSIQNPFNYINTNIFGFTNILECSLESKVRHFIYASSSSVYGLNSKMPYSEDQPTNHQISMYAVTKKTNELIAHSYSSLFGLPSTGLRFFTVYGPWGRPDMALFNFTKSILENKKINLYNNGNHMRDFTYIDDIINTIVHLIDLPPSSNPNWLSSSPDPSYSSAPWQIFNIGNGDPINLIEYLNILEEILGKKADISYAPLQLGDVLNTHSDTNKLSNILKVRYKTDIHTGLNYFVKWYLDYYKKNF
jgi:UDP-glucuronate 4-epimerase